MTPSIRIPPAEFAQRAQALQARLAERKLGAAVLFDAHYILYYTGFAFIPTERPVGLVVTAQGKSALFVPRLEAEHAKAQARVDEVADYPEYPGTQHPMTRFKALLDELGLDGPLGADQDGYPWLFGYRGPSLSELSGRPPAPLRAEIEDQMAIKSANEVALLRESAKWANLAHTLLQRYTAVGRTETEVAQRASDEATRAMLDAIGPVYRAQSAWFSGAAAGYRGQIGRNAAIPHALANNLTFRAGDVLVTGATAPVWGYHAELERTMVVGPPGDAQRRLFGHMLAMQDLALDALGPGRPCSAVDEAVLGYVKRHKLEPHWRHHTGHAIGLRYHEGPFLDRGDATEMLPGMVFTVEPGLYAPELGGFRHSDTAAITDDGAEPLTFYPRDLDSLTLPA